MDMKSMNIVQLRQYFQELKIDEVKSLLQDGKIAKMGDLELNLLFLNARDEVKKVLLDDKEIFEHLMSMPLNKMKKSFIDLVDEDLREYIYHHENLRFSTSGKVRVCEYLQKLPLNSFRKYLEDDSLDLVYQQDVLTVLSNSGLLDSYTKGLVENAIKNFEFRNIALFKLKHPLEVLIYTKFHLLVKVQEVKGDCVVIGDREIAIDFLRRVNKKHITTLISLVLKREANATHEEVLIGILKLYMVFGFDNSKKVLEDTFTYATDLSIKRASVEIFKDVRRAYRLENQNKYYYHGMEDDFLKALESENLEYFKTFVGKEREDEAKNIYQKLEVLQRTFQGQELREQIRGLLLEEIQKREAFYQLRDFMKYTKYYQALKRDKQIQVEDIYLLFSEVNLDYQLSQEGKVLPDLELTKFLLGNCKRDNDCLLRMVLNNEALGLNKELPKIINHFTTISKNISKNSQLSLYSILDVIDISKVFLYHLKPDELDITLSTLSEILNSRKYCTEPPEVIMERTLKLHRDRKKKVSSAIPMISGEYEGVSYSMALFDDEALLVSGIETGSCFKVGGKGEDFLRYCLTDPCGMVFYIEYLGVKYVLPVTVNGNMLNINSIDPRIEDRDIYLRILRAIQEISKKLVNSNATDIEMVTMTDIHHEEVMRSIGSSKVSFEKFIPLGTDCYNDYMKKEVTNYVLYRKDETIQPKYFRNTKRFYPKRKQPYIFTPTTEYDQERLSILINSISYASIEFRSISEEEKEKEREFYMPLDVSDFLYIVGSKDWFIGISKNYEIVSSLLYYDERAVLEYQKYLQVAENLVLENKEGRKR